MGELSVETLARAVDLMLSNEGFVELPEAKIKRLKLHPTCNWLVQPLDLTPSGEMLSAHRYVERDAAVREFARVVIAIRGDDGVPEGER